VRLSTTPATSILAGGFLVSTLCELGRYDEAERTVDDVTEIATSLRDVHSLGSAQVTRCILAVARGDVDAAIPPLEMLRAAAKAAGALQILQIIETLLGRAKLVAGDLPSALELLKSAGEHGVAQRGSVDRLTNVWFAEALAASGAVGQAQAILDGVEVEAESHAEAATLVHCWATRGRIAQTVGDVAAAKAAFGRALKAASTLSMRPVVEICEAGLAAIAALKTAAPGAAT
jgi:tetratricopeptide (TPR) repeat protein